MIELLPSLSQEQQQKLECDISLEELTAELKQLEDSKAPGLDGFPAEFYRLWSILGPALMETLHESLDQGELPLSCRRAVLCLLPKKRDLQEITNWRPMSVLNTDYKIVSKVLAMSLKNVFSLLIGNDQTYCTPERSIYGSIFCHPLFEENGGILIWVCPSVPLSLCPSVRLSVCRALVSVL